MTGPTLLQSPVLQRLGGTLAQFLWQGSILAALLASANVLLARRRAELRYAASCAALLLMLGWAAATFIRWRPQPPPGANRAASRDAAVAASVPVHSPAGPLRASFLSAAARGAAARLSTLEPWLVTAWLTGVMLLSLRFLYGWRRAQALLTRTSPAPPAFDRPLARLARRLRVSRPVRLLQSAAVKVPMAIGSLRPVILLPVAAATGLSAEELEAILAHELAHIRRHDYFVNLLQTLAETLLFYHPAVWWVSRQIRIERENCCDDLAIGATGDPRLYARALFGLETMRGGVPEPAVAASGGLLWRRIARLFPETTPERAPAWPVGLLALLAVGALGAVTGLAFDEPVEKAVAPLAAVSTPAPARARTCPSTKEAPRPPARRSASRATVARTVEATSASQPAPAAVEAFGEPPAPPEPPEEASLEQTDERRAHGVTPEFAKAIAAEGFDRVSSDDLISLRVHGVTPEFLRAMTRLFGKQSLETHVSLRIHGVDAEWVESLSRAGLSTKDADEAISLRIHGVTPEFLGAFREAGYSGISADEAVSLRIHGVRPSDATAWTNLGFPGPSLEGLVSLRIHGVDPEFARQMRAEGISSGDLDDLIALRIHGVTPGFVRDYRALGYTSLTADEATSFRIHGVEPEFVQQLQSLGYRSVPPDDLVSLRIHGVTPEFIRRRNEKAGERLSLETLIEMRVHGAKGD